MSETILVTYASRHGSTREIADDIAKVLYERGAKVVTRATDEVGDLVPYYAVVLGSAIYEGDWLPEATDFMRRFADKLEGLPLWLFSSGTAGDIPTETMREWTHPQLLDSLFARVQPRGHVVFGGSFDPHRLSVGDWWRYPSLRGVKGDYRDWNAVEAWANEIANTLPSGTLTLPPNDVGTTLKNRV